MSTPVKGLFAVALVGALAAACGSSSPGTTSGTAGASGGSAGASGSAGSGSAGEVRPGAGSAGAGSAGSAGAGSAGSGSAGAGAAGGAGTTATGTAGASADAGTPDGGTDATQPHDGPVLTGTVKVMVLGSSNEVITCWRAFLWQKLQTAGLIGTTGTNVKFVGGQTDGPDCNVPNYDMHDESHSAIPTTTVPASTFLAEFRANPPQIVLQHFGGADVLANNPIAPIIAAYTTVLQQARMVNPNVIFLAAQHTPEIDATCNDCIANTMKLNAAMVPWAAANTTAASPIILVDLFTGLDTTTDFSDGVHLNVAGAEIVSDRWLAALLPILKP
jgi:lysophospholipase L1-like esterase